MVSTKPAAAQSVYRFFSNSSAKTTHGRETINQVLSVAIVQDDQAARLERDRIIGHLKRQRLDGALSVARVGVVAGLLFSGAAEAFIWIAN